VARRDRARRANDYHPRGLMPMRPELCRRGALLAASLICIALCAGCGELHAQAKVGPPRPVIVAVDGQPSAAYAPLYVARADGDFALGALAVTIEHPRGADSLRALESRVADIAFASEPALLAARDGGAQLVAIGALIRQPLDGIVSLASQPIADVRALAGHTIALHATRLAQAELASALAAVRLAPSHVRQIAVAGDPSRALSNHSAVATLGGVAPIQVVTLALAHQPAHWLAIQQTGVPTYSQLVVVVRVSEAHDEGPLLRAFLQSLTRGERATAANPAAAAATLAKANPSLSARFERAMLALTLPISSPVDPGQPFGYQYPLQWRTFGAWMARHGLLAHPSDAALAVTNEFLPGQGV
jgi:putative hydroxymethylpyrimidine transport system substrate-binding protein